MRHTSAQGFSLVSAIFLIVVVATLATFMVTIGSVQQSTSTLSVLASRALFAADSGMQWAIRDVVANNACFTAPDDSFSLSGGITDGYDIRLTCSVTNVDEGPDNYNVFRLTATATRSAPGDVDFHRRSIAASVTTAP